MWQKSHTLQLVWRSSSLFFSDQIHPVKNISRISTWHHPFAILKHEHPKQGPERTKRKLPLLRGASRIDDSMHCVPGMLSPSLWSRLGAIRVLERYRANSCGKVGLVKFVFKVASGKGNATPSLNRFYCIDLGALSLLIFRSPYSHGVCHGAACQAAMRNLMPDPMTSTWKNTRQTRGDMGYRPLPFSPYLLPPCTTDFNINSNWFSSIPEPQGLRKATRFVANFDHDLR